MSHDDPLYTLERKQIPGAPEGAWMIETKATDAGRRLLIRYAEYEQLAISQENPYKPDELRIKVLGLILLDCLEPPKPWSLSDE